MEEGLWDCGTISLVKILPDSAVHHQQEVAVSGKSNSIHPCQNYTALLSSSLSGTAPLLPSSGSTALLSSSGPRSTALLSSSGSGSTTLLSPPSSGSPSSTSVPVSLSCLVEADPSLRRSYTKDDPSLGTSFSEDNLSMRTSCSEDDTSMRISCSDDCKGLLQPTFLPHHQICIADSNDPIINQKIDCLTTQIHALKKQPSVQQKYIITEPAQTTTLLTRIKQDPDSVKPVGDSRPAGGGKILTGAKGKLVTVPGRLVFNPVTGLVVSTTSEKQTQSSTPGSPGRSSPDRSACTSTTHSTTSPKEIKEEEVTRRYCLVCGDVASGFHYGVSSCEACKAFFKRTIQGNIEYTCPANGDCEINKRRRKACQACRFQKCLRKGMLKEGVRLDRVRGGRQKYRRVTESTAYVEVQSTRIVSLEENHILECLSSSEPEILSIQECEVEHLRTDLKCTAVLADIYDRELVLTIGWAKQVPGFSDLSLNDQMKLLQSGWTEVLTLTLVYRSLPKLGKLNFASDFSLTESEASQTGLHKFFTKCMSIVDRLESLGVTREEYLILKGLVLTNTDCHLEDISVIHSLRETIMSSLQDCVCAIRSGDAGLMVQQLLLVLPGLREADHLLRTFWSNVRKDGTVPMNRLLVEMLENN